MPVGWWEYVRQQYLLECLLAGVKPDPEWLAAWEQGRVQQSSVWLPSLL